VSWCSRGLVTSRDGRARGLARGRMVWSAGRGGVGCPHMCARVSGSTTSHRPSPPARVAPRAKDALHPHAHWKHANQFTLDDTSPWEHARVFKVPRRCRSFLRGADYCGTVRRTHAWFMPRRKLVRLQHPLPGQFRREWNPAVPSAQSPSGLVVRSHADLALTRRCSPCPNAKTPSVTREPARPQARRVQSFVSPALLTTGCHEASFVAHDRPPS
jgi:hypothetical protein